MHKKWSKDFSSTFHIKWSLPYIPRSSKNYICFMRIWALGTFGKTGSLTTLTSCLREHKNLSKDCSSTFHINWGITLVPRTSCAKVIWGFSYTFLTGLLALGKSEKTGPVYPKIVCRATQKNQNPHLHTSRPVSLYFIVKTL